MTYSIVARDPASGQLGVAIQSHYFCVGDGAPWVQADVGAVSTQAFIQRSFGPDGLAKLEHGMPVRAVVEELVAADDEPETRQVGIVDRNGEAFAFTGERCVAHAGHCVGDGVTAQANLVSSPTIWPAMIAEFEATQGRLADRLLRALLAAEAEGGDRRGRQSAAMIVRGAGGEAVNLRVDDHPDPLAELARLLDLRRAYDSIERATGFLASSRNGGNLDQVLAEVEAAAATLGANPEGTFWAGVVLARSGRIAEARNRFAICAAASPGWLDVVRSLSDAGMLDGETVSRVLPEPRAVS